MVVIIVKERRKLAFINGALSLCCVIDNVLGYILVSTTLSDLCVLEVYVSCVFCTCMHGHTSKVITLILQNPLGYIR